MEQFFGWVAFVVAVVGLAILGLPWVVYVSMKLGTFAYFRGRELFYQSREKRNGEEK